MLFNIKGMLDDVRPRPDDTCVLGQQKPQRKPTGRRPLALAKMPAKLLQMYMTARLCQTFLLRTKNSCKTIRRGWLGLAAVLQTTPLAASV